MFYPDELIEEIRSRNDIVGVIGSYIRLQKKGSNYMGLCPFHNEKTPSFSVSASKQMYYCFGCGVGGNVFTFLMEYENYTFLEALRSLAERAGIALPEQELSEEARKQSDLRTKLLEVNKQAANYYYYQLKNKEGQPAYEYLVNRGLTGEMIKHFGLGYSNRSSDDLYRYLKKLNYDDEFLAQTGLVTIDERLGGRDKFRNRVMFPIMDTNHRVIGFGGRIMEKAGSEIPKYLNTPETMIFEKSRTLYGLNFAKGSRKSYFLVCEGYMDVITLHQAGFSNAVAALGTAFTGFHANMLKRYVKEVMLTFDSDQAGIKAALRAIPILKEAGIAVKVVDMKPFKDPDELIKALGAGDYQNRVEEARSSFFFEIDTLQKSFDMTDPEQKTRFFHETAKKLITFNEELERNFYIDAVAKTYQIDVEPLRRLVNRIGSQTPAGMRGTEEPRKEIGRGKPGAEEGITKVQKLMLTWLIENNSLFDKLNGLLGPEDFTEGICRKTAELVFSQYRMQHSVNPAKIINCFESKEEQSEAAAFFSAGIQGEMDQTGWQKALSDTVIRLKEYSLDRKSQKAIEANDTVLLMKLIKEKAELKKRSISFDD